MIAKCIGIIMWLLLIPFCMGLLPACLGCPGWLKTIVKNKKDEQSTAPIREKISPAYTLVSGYILMWALFQLVAVPFILKAGSFTQVSTTFESLASGAALAGILLAMWRFRGEKRAKVQFTVDKGMLLQGIMWMIFLGSVCFQLYMSYKLAYADGDDAYYLPISTAANLGGSMYQVDSYTGAPTTLDMRHGLAPFPIWISFIAAKCMVNAAVAAQTLVPLVLIPITYLIYLEIGKILCGQRRKVLPIFMLFVSLLQIFGNYSIYPASTFLLTRTRQGKEALGNIVLPFLVLVLLQMGKQLQENGSIKIRQVLLLVAASFAGCLCSTMSSFLIAMLVMLTVFLFLLLYRNGRAFVAGVLGIAPCIVYALLYFRLK